MRHAYGCVPALHKITYVQSGLLRHSAAISTMGRIDVAVPHKRREEAETLDMSVSKYFPLKDNPCETYLRTWLTPRMNHSEDRGCRYWRSCKTYWPTRSRLDESPCRLLVKICKLVISLPRATQAIRMYRLSCGYSGPTFRLDHLQLMLMNISNKPNCRVMVIKLPLSIMPIASRSYSPFAVSTLCT